MLIPLEGLVPSEKSVVWRIHDAYFARRGAEAWREGEIPFHATSHYVIARGHARLLCRLVAELEAAGTLAPAEPVEVLELGCGLGRFAANFLRALRKGCGARGRSLAPRLRYFLSDFAPLTVRQAIATPALAADVEAGRVVPALHDLRRPDELRSLQGGSLAPRLTAVLASYVACVAPVRPLRKTRDGWSQKLQRASLEVAPRTLRGRTPAAVRRELLADPTAPGLMGALVVEPEWRPVSLARALPDPVDAEALDATLAPLREATVAYPFAWSRALRALAGRLVAGGLVLVNDMGTATREQLSGIRDVVPTHFGNTLNHGFAFALLDELCPRAGLSCVRTLDVLRSVHVCAIRKLDRVPASFAAAFRATYRASDADVLDFRAAARLAREKGEWLAATRLFQRCLDLDPYDPDVWLLAGDSALKALLPEHALHFLGRGRRLAAPGAAARGFDVLLGRAAFEARRLALAARSFRRALEAGGDAEARGTAEACTGLALVHVARNELARAARCVDEALAADPEHARALELRRALELNRAARTSSAPPSARPRARPARTRSGASSRGRP